QRAVLRLSFVHMPSREEVAAQRSKSVAEVRTEMAMELRDPEEAVATADKTADPLGWARAQRALGNAILGGPMRPALEAEQDRAKRAIECLEAALTVLSEDHHPEDWARAHRALASAYAFPLAGDQDERKQRKLEHFEAAHRGFKKAGLEQEALY